MSNESIERKVDKIVEAESFFNKYALQIIIMIFIAGGGWITLQNVDALAQENKESIEEEKARSQEIEKKLIRIETQQEQISKDVEENQQTLKAILNAVQKLDTKEE